VVETEGSKSDLVAPVRLDSDSTGPLSVSDKLSAGLMYYIKLSLHICYQGRTHDLWVGGV
jgi:hypothetical protein